MRLLLDIFSFIALALAPLASPAQAVAAAGGSHCAAMKNDMPHHSGKSPIASDGKCCPAVPAALPTTGQDPNFVVPSGTNLVAGPQPQLTNVEVEEDDPPPRS